MSFAFLSYMQKQARGALLSSFHRFFCPFSSAGELVLLLLYKVFKKLAIFGNEPGPRHIQVPLSLLITRLLRRPTPFNLTSQTPATNDLSLSVQHAHSHPSHNLSLAHQSDAVTKYRLSKKMKFTHLALALTLAPALAFK